MWCKETERCKVSESNLQAHKAGQTGDERRMYPYRDVVGKGNRSFREEY
jgi:hypothetical protein